MRPSRPSEHVPRREYGGSEQERREVYEREHSPTPSYSESYGLEGDEDEDSEEDRPGRESDRGSTATHEPTSQRASSTVPPQKPKRTRQLTTPHQSAILHALLAQSRFPTTQMREEVGRQIGLSSRKVQVWFQNQRQKARKESKEAAAAAAAGGTPVRGSGPPQFGPFTNVPPGPSAVSGVVIVEGSSSGRSRTRQGRTGESSTPVGYDRGPGPGFPTIVPASEIPAHATAPLRRASDPSLDVYSVTGAAALRRSSGGDLTGPGVPGSGATIDSFPQSSASPDVASTRYPRPLSPEQPPSLPPVHPLLSPASRYGTQAPALYRPERFEQGSSSQSLRLPPIQVRSTDRHQEAFVGSHRYPAPATFPTPFNVHPRPRGSIAVPVLSRGRGEATFSPVNPPPIPPPFTLEPNPVWQTTPAISTPTHTQSGPVSHSTPSAASSRQPPLTSETMLESLTLPPPTRTTRFDPVRNTEIAAIQPPGRTRSHSSSEEN